MQDREFAKKYAQVAAETREIDAQNHAQLVDGLVAIGKESREGDDKGDKNLPDE